MSGWDEPHPCPMCAGEQRVDELIHVLPIDDSAQHRDSMDCWCVPTPDEQESLVIVHHSADGRELMENV